MATAVSGAHQDVARAVRLLHMLEKTDFENL